MLFCLMAALEKLKSSKMSSDQLENVSFDFIRYANCWEDPEILLKGLQINNQSKALSIASAGDNSFALLTKDPELVVAVDINETQLFLCELKVAGIKHLDREDFLVLMGFREGNRLRLFDQLAGKLSSECRGYFETFKDEFELGIVYQGKFEKYFHLFSNKILPWIHSKKTIDQLFKEKSEDDQLEFYNSKWNNWRWRLLFKIFFSKYVMGKFGRDPEFLKEVEVNVGSFIFNKAENELSNIKAQRNFMLNFILKGVYNQLPLYVQEEHYETVRENLGSIELFKGLAEDAFKKYGAFNRFNLSNIFEYMNKEVFALVGNQMYTGAENDSLIAYWNLMVPRNLADVNEKLEYQSALSEQLTKEDAGFFYRQFLVNHVRK